MEKVGVFYATKEGQARKVAERIGAALVLRGLEVAVHEVREQDAAPALARSEAAVIVGSVHVGQHERELVAFVRAHRERLEAIPSAFVSVCGAEGVVESASAPSAARAEAAARIQTQLHVFEEKTGWHPAHVRPVAGAYVFTHYNPLVRWVMKRIARGEGMPTDASRDHELTDWLALDDFARGFAEELHAPGAPSAA